MDYRHKIIDGMASGDTYYPIPNPPGSFRGSMTERHMSKLRSELSVAHGFDLCAIEPTFCAQLLATSIEASYEDMLPLPFDVTLFNFGNFLKDKNKVICDLVVKNDFGFTVQEIIRVTDKWLIMPWLACVYTGKEIKNDGLGVKQINFANAHKLEEANHIQAKGSAQRVLQSLVCLETKHIRLVDQEAPDKLNKAREKRGASPISGHKIVTIDIESAEIEASDHGGTHASPRLHWRRGHIRRLADGIKTKVKPCLVGDPTAARVSQEWRAHA